MTDIISPDNLYLAEWYITVSTLNYLIIIHVMNIL